MSDTNGWVGYSISADTLGHIFCAAGASGSYYYHVYFYYEKDTFRINNAVDAAIVLKLDTAGNIQCGSLERSGGDDASGIVSDPTGSYVYWGGDLLYGSSYIFGTDTLFGEGEYPFVARWQPCTNIPEGTNEVPAKTNSISLFPNPSTGKFTLEVKSDNVKVKNIEVFNVLGERVFSEILRSAQDDKVMDLSAQPNGVYFYRVLSEDGALVGEGKVVVEK